MKEDNTYAISQQLIRACPLPTEYRTDLKVKLCTDLGSTELISITAEQYRKIELILLSQD